MHSMELHLSDPAYRLVEFDMPNYHPGMGNLHPPFLGLREGHADPALPSKTLLVSNKASSLASPMTPVSMLSTNTVQMVRLPAATSSPPDMHHASVSSNFSASPHNRLGQSPAPSTFFLPIEIDPGTMITLNSDNQAAQNTRKLVIISLPSDYLYNDPSVRHPPDNC